MLYVTPELEDPLRPAPDLSYQVFTNVPLDGCVPLLYGSLASNHNVIPVIVVGLKLLTTVVVIVLVAVIEKL